MTTKTAQHTPGPWAATKKEIGDFYIEGAAEEDIANVYGWSGAKAECEANARLIAAAPEMFEALKKAADYMGEMGHPDDLLAEARAALAKAGYDKFADEDAP